MRLLCAPARDFQVHVPARLLKDQTISPTAKLLWVIIRAYADARTRVSYVTPARLDKLLRCSRGKREAAQRELVGRGCLKVHWVRGQRGKWARRLLTVLDPPHPPLGVFTAAVKTPTKYSSPNTILKVFSQVKSSHHFPKTLTRFSEKPVKREEGADLT
jgi:hypothetical protein